MYIKSNYSCCDKKKQITSSITWWIRKSFKNTMDKEIFASARSALNNHKKSFTNLILNKVPEDNFKTKSLFFWQRIWRCKCFVWKVNNITPWFCIPYKINSLFCNIISNSCTFPVKGYIKFPSTKGVKIRNIHIIWWNEASENRPLLKIIFKIHFLVRKITILFIFNIVYNWLISINMPFLISKIPPIFNNIFSWKANFYRNLTKWLVQEQFYPAKGLKFLWSLTMNRIKLWPNLNNSINISRLPWILFMLSIKCPRSCYFYQR